jgi:HSP20 family protein
MVSLTRWDNPLRELDSLISRFNNNLAIANDANSEITSPEWAPKIDIKENLESYLIKAELPGVAKEDVNVTLENGLLTIRGEKKVEQSTTNDKIHRTECLYGSFVRSFRLPANVEEGKVSARYKDGILNLTIPKSAKAKPKEITIAVE